MIEHSDRRKKATLERNVLYWNIVPEGALSNVVEEEWQWELEGSLAVRKPADHICSTQKKADRMLTVNGARP